jgi:Zn-dependent protease with chaperone function
MTSARRFYRLPLTLGAAGLLVALLSLAVALRALDFSLPAAGTLLESCRSLLVPHGGASALLVLGLAGLGLAVLVRAARTAMRQLRASRRFIRGLTLVRTDLRDGATIAVFDSERPQAFCAGFLRPRIYVSTAAAALPPQHLRPVIAHECHHLRRRDPLRILLARTMGDALFFVPSLRRLADRYAALAEVAADEAAVREHDRNALAAALLSFGQGSNPAAVVGIAPERVDCLLGEPPRWELPVSLLLGSAVAIAGLGGLAVGAHALTAGAELNLPLLLAQSCMLLMVALPLLLAVGALSFARSPRLRPRAR